MKNTIMKIITVSLFGVMLSFMVSCADEPNPQNNPVSIPAVDKLTTEPKSFTRSDVESFVSRFYSTLELTKEMNQRAYEESLPFNSKAFYDCVDNQSIYSKKRLDNLTGDNHTYYGISLLNIDSFSTTSNLYEVYTTVEYSIYEVGTIQNIEKLTIENKSNRLVISKWEDIDVKKLEILEYDGLENYNKRNFYKEIGSVNK